MTWQLDSRDAGRKLTPRTKAIVAVHLYGLPADVTALRTLADHRGIQLIEDCAEAIGSRIDGRHVGADSGRLRRSALFGNKTITTGEGGLVVTDRDDLHRACRAAQGTGPGGSRRLLARHRRLQLPDDEHLRGDWLRADDAHRRDSCVRRSTWPQRYRERLRTIAGIEFSRQPRLALGAQPLDDDRPRRCGDTRTRVMAFMREQGIETTAVFPPVHRMPMYPHYERALSGGRRHRRARNQPSFVAADVE